MVKERQRCRECGSYDITPGRVKHRSYICRSCLKSYGERNADRIKERNAAYYIRNAEKVKARTAVYRALNPDRAKNRAASGSLNRKYGITTDERNRLLADQGGTCAICKTVPKKPAVDHCHSNGKIRGVLCNSCNSVIGFAKDNPETLASAMEYLSLHRNSPPARTGTPEGVDTEHIIT